MKISVALFDKDTEYTGRLSDYFQTHYSKSVLMTVFSEEEIFLREIENQYFNLAIIPGNAAYLKEKVPARTVPILLVNDNSVTEIGGIRAIGKFQSATAFYKHLIGFCAENTAEVKNRMIGQQMTEVRLFTSVQGGAGVSSAAAAFSMNRAAQGKKVFYLNLETFGNASHYFHGIETGTMSDIIYALKSTNINLDMKLQSVVCTAECGVDFIPHCINAYDMLELKDSEIQRLVDAISGTGNYNYLVIDYSSQLTERQVFLMREVSDSIVYVSDGSITGNAKFMRFCEAVRVIEKREICRILDKMQLMYNRFSTQTGKQMEEVPIPVAGVVGRYEGLSSDVMVKRLSGEQTVQTL